MPFTFIKTVELFVIVAVCDATGVETLYDDDFIITNIICKLEIKLTSSHVPSKPE